MENHFDKIMTLYRGSKIKENPTCIECYEEDPGLSPAVSVYYIGEEYNLQSKKILFVGKNARGTLENGIDQFPVIDARESARKYFLYPDSAFWSYSQAITRALFKCSKEEALEKISLTNLVKCNNAMGDEGRNPDGSTIDQTTFLMKENCLNKVGYFWREVKILKPTHIILFSGADYDQFLFGGKHNTDRRRIGQKNVLWFAVEWIIDGHKTKLLRTGHPERLKKEDFVSGVCEWVLMKEGI